MEDELVGLTLNEEEDAILQVQLEPNTERGEEIFRLVGCFLAASIIHFPAMKNTMTNLWHPVKGVHI
ncbi:hypothetical protein Goarm_004453 [Gossypium armourianum]|uniref:Uncharacterized protein n=1 Tax=Gossypium armourianum TaxID=34283 RepID=A0A7J9JWT7_9ROSI|nr:hypothetical protein [Gossypium armourianum]